MPDDPTAGPPEPNEPRAKKITCDFCESKLAPSGEVLQMSETAKGFRDLARQKEDWTREKTELEGTIQTLRDENERLKHPSGPSPDPAPAPRKKPFLFREETQRPA